MLCEEKFMLKLASFNETKKKEGGGGGGIEKKDKV